MSWVCVRAQFGSVWIRKWMDRMNSVAHINNTIDIFHSWRYTFCLRSLKQQFIGWIFQIYFEFKGIYSGIHALQFYFSSLQTGKFLILTILILAFFNIFLRILFKHQVALLSLKNIFVFHWVPDHYSKLYCHWIESVSWFWSLSPNNSVKCTHDIIYNNNKSKCLMLVWLCFTTVNVLRV